MKKFIETVDTNKLCEIIEKNTTFVKKAKYISTYAGGIYVILISETNAPMCVAQFTGFGGKLRLFRCDSIEEIIDIGLLQQLKLCATIMNGEIAKELD